MAGGEAQRLGVRVERHEDGSGDLCSACGEMRARVVARFAADGSAVRLCVGCSGRLVDGIQAEDYGRPY